MSHANFNFAGLKEAFETPDIPALIAFYAGDAGWLEYKAGSPLSAPYIMRGKESIHQHVQGAAEYGIKITIRDEVIGDERLAFCMIINAPDGRTGIEHVIIHHRDGKIYRHVDVEVWD
jgi:hypothetical protein